jgi:transcriptional regulator with XRE-family HTH domain
MVDGAVDDVVVSSLMAKLLTEQAARTATTEPAASIAATRRRLDRTVVVTGIQQTRSTDPEKVTVDGCTDRASPITRARRSVVAVDNRSEVREFLTSRRAKVTPPQAGLPETLHRRVPGLRRSEVAALAGMSVEYYAKLERGSLGGVSAGVLDAIAHALQLDEAERAHLFHLAHAADGTSAAMRPRRRVPKQWTVRPSLQWTLDSITTAPAIVGNNRSDLLATNHLGRALYTDVYNDANSPANFARFTFLDAAAHRFYPDWDSAAEITVANLRTAAGQDPHDKALQDLVGELSTRSDDFRRRWAAHNVRTHGTGTKHFHHHIVGDLTLAYESLDLRAEPGLTMTIYAAEPDSPTAHSLALLASWAATQEPTPVPAH